MTFYCYEKEPFLAIARALPRPLKKKMEYADKPWAKVRVETQAFTAINVAAAVDRDKSCEIIEPAKPASLSL